MVRYKDWAKNEWKNINMLRKKKEKKTFKELKKDYITIA